MRPSRVESLSRTKRGAMPVTSGFNHVATLTADMDRLVGVLQNRLRRRGSPSRCSSGPDHPHMIILDLGGWRRTQRLRSPRATRSSATAATRVLAGGDRSLRPSPSTPKPRSRQSVIALAAAGADIGEIQQLGKRVVALLPAIPDGMELEGLLPRRLVQAAATALVTSNATAAPTNAGNAPPAHPRVNNHERRYGRRVDASSRATTARPTIR